MEQILTVIEAAHLLRCSRAHVQNVVGAVAQFERELIAERVRAGMAHAPTTGKQIGRPRASVYPRRVSELRADGLSLLDIAKALRVPISRVRRSLAAAPAASRDFPVVIRT
jgi:DNA invertase Pin-like site-specific DNA recombinase